MLFRGSARQYLQVNGLTERNHVIHRNVTKWLIGQRFARHGCLFQTPERTIAVPDAQKYIVILFHALSAEGFWCRPPVAGWREIVGGPYTAARWMTIFSVLNASVIFPCGRVNSVRKHKLDAVPELKDTISFCWAEFNSRVASLIKRHWHGIGDIRHRNKCRNIASYSSNERESSVLQRLRNKIRFAVIAPIWTTFDGNTFSIDAQKGSGRWISSWW